MPNHDMNDPRVRRSLAQHYAKIARKAQRQAKLREFLHEPRFAFFDMILLALTAALLGAGWVWIVDRL